MRTVVAVLFFLTLVAACTLDQKIVKADVIVDVAGTVAAGEYDDVGNSTIVIPLAPGTVITGISWTNLEFVANSPSRLNELVFSLTSSNKLNYWDFRLTNSVSSGSSTGIAPSSGNVSNFVFSDSSSGGNSLTVGADGILLFNFYDTFDDTGIDQNIVSGMFTITTVPEPSAMVVSMAVAGCAIVSRRLRLRKAAKVA